MAVLNLKRFMERTISGTSHKRSSPTLRKGYSLAMIVTKLLLKHAGMTYIAVCTII